MKQQLEIRCLVDAKNGLRTPPKKASKRGGFLRGCTDHYWGVVLLFRLLSLRTFVLSFFPRGKKERTKEKKAVGFVLPRWCRAGGVAPRPASWRCP